MRACQHCGGNFCGSCRTVRYCVDCDQGLCDECEGEGGELSRTECQWCSETFCGNCRSFKNCDWCQHDTCDQCLDEHPVQWCDECEQRLCYRCNPQHAVCAYCHEDVCTDCAGLGRLAICDGCDIEVCNSCAENWVSCSVCSESYCGGCAKDANVKTCRRCANSALDALCHGKFFGIAQQHTAAAAGPATNDATPATGTAPVASGAGGCDGEPSPPSDRLKALVSSSISSSRVSVSGGSDSSELVESSGQASETGAERMEEGSEGGLSATAALAGTSSSPPTLLCVHCALIRAAVRAARHAGWRWCRACRWRLCGGSQLTAENCCRRGACVPHAYSRIEPTSSMMAPAT